MPLNLPLWKVIISLAILLVMSSAIILAGRRHHYLVVGWLWFLVTLLPVIGLIQVGTQSMADRYSYIPVIGLFIMVTWGVSDLLEGFKYGKGILALLAGLIIISSTALTRQQLGYWQDNISLYRHTLQVTTDNDKINTNLGVALAEKGDINAAIHEFKEALRINPYNRQARNNLGIALQNMRAQDEAPK
jgi:tetratricopeptide (TPR) repeat protein